PSRVVPRAALESGRLRGHGTARARWNSASRGLVNARTRVLIAALGPAVNRSWEPVREYRGSVGSARIDHRYRGGVKRTDLSIAASLIDQGCERGRHRPTV